METEHTEGHGLCEGHVRHPAGRDLTADGEGTPVAPSTVPEDILTSDEAMRLDPHAYAFNKIVERSRRVDGA